MPFSSLGISLVNINRLRQAPLLDLISINMMMKKNQTVLSLNELLAIETYEFVKIDILLH